MSVTPLPSHGRFRRVAINLRHGVMLAWAASARALVAYSLLGVINAAIPPVVVVLGAILVNRIAETRVRALTFGEFVPVLAILFVATAAQRAVGGYMGHGRNLFIRRVHFEAERRLLTHAATLDLAHFDNSDWHDRLARAKRDVTWRPGDLTWSVLSMSGAVVSLGLMSTLLASLDYALFALALIAAGSSLLLEHRVTSRLYAFLYNETPGERERDYLADLLANPRMSKEIRAYVLAAPLLDRHRRVSDQLIQQRVHLYQIAIRSSIVAGILHAVTIMLAYALVAFKGLAGTIDAGGVVLVIGAFTAVSGTLAQIVGTCVAVDQHTTFLDDYFSFLRIQPRQPLPRQPRPLPAKLTDGVRFENVTFTYPGISAPAVERLNLHLRDGELLALVGDNGTGKSTIVKLLLRLYDPQHGSIRIGGVDVRDVHPDEVRRRIGVMFQDYATYELTIRDNITLGRAEVAHDDRRVIQALSQAHAGALMGKMPNGLDSQVGRLFEGGRSLSGGEWQRLALARMMYRDADIWILDEPTSSLDPEAEAAIFTELKANLKGRIGLVISHRFSTVRVADRIAVISGGQIAELGTHHELLAANGRYASLFELQAAGYR